MIGKGNDTNIVPQISALIFDPSPNVRLQLLVTLSKLPKDQAVLGLLKRDPFPEIPKHMYGKPLESHVFEWYMALIVNPIRKMFDVPDVALSTVPPVSVKLLKPNLRRRMGVANVNAPRLCQLQFNRTLENAAPVTSNLANGGSDRFVYGLQSGELCFSSWSEQRLLDCRYRLSSCAIAHVGHSFNKGFPLTMASSVDGNMYIAVVDDGGLSLKSAFKVCEKSFKFEVDEVGRLFSIPTKSRGVILHDLQRERQLPELVPLHGAPTMVRSFAGMSDVVAVCANGLELFDMRCGCSSIVSFFDETVAPTFDVSMVVNDPTSFVLCHTQDVWSLCDARRPDRFRHYSAIGGEPVLSFASQANGPVIAISYLKNGILLMDVQNQHRIEMTSASAFFVPRKLRGVTSCLWHPGECLLGVVQGSEISILGAEK
jgi:hypothetical protein